MVPPNMLYQVATRRRSFVSDSMFEMASIIDCVPRGAGHQRGLRLQQSVDVVEARDPDAALGRADHLLARGVAAGQSDVERGAVIGGPEVPRAAVRRKPEAVGVGLVDHRRMGDA